ncbi:MAG: hypothetical protein E6J93_01845 [Methanobacteriota archaeon]|nr:MAG: hypothetical protein E6J93_01845 [Euryarchaeota archaeon]
MWIRLTSGRRRAKLQDIITFTMEESPQRDVGLDPARNDIAAPALLAVDTWDTVQLEARGSGCMGLPVAKRDEGRGIIRLDILQSAEFRDSWE